MNSRFHWVEREMRVALREYQRLPDWLKFEDDSNSSTRQKEKF